MIHKLKNKFNVNFQTDEIYKYLFHANWNKAVVDKNRIHDYSGFSQSLIETKDNWVINLANYTSSGKICNDLDNQLSKILNNKVKTNFVNLLPCTNVGRHWDILSEPCNTSIVWKVFGNVEVRLEDSNKIFKEIVNSNYALILNTDKIHDAYNYTKQVQWIATSLVYNITYDEVIKIFSEEGMTFF
jgi:hypothetical protein